MANRVENNSGVLLSVSLFFGFGFLILLASCAKSTLSQVTQVDRVGRPFMNEVFLYTQANSNAFNALAPSSDVLGVSTAIRTEMNAVFALIHTYATGAGFASGPTAAQVSAGFIPDVLRIDTTLTTSTVGNWAYSKSTSLAGGETLLLGGRKIEDDVWDITASYLFNGSLTGGPATAVSQGADRICYEGSSSTRCTGASALLQGHNLLYGATAYNGTSQFPFLPAPN